MIISSMTWAAARCTVVRACALLREELKRDVPIVHFFEHPTVHALARRLEQAVSPDDAQQQSPGSRGGTPAGPPAPQGPEGAVAMAEQDMMDEGTGTTSRSSAWRGASPAPMTSTPSGGTCARAWSPSRSSARSELERSPLVPEAVWKHPATSSAPEASSRGRSSSITASSTSRCARRSGWIPSSASSSSAPGPRSRMPRMIPRASRADLPLRGRGGLRAPAVAARRGAQGSRRGPWLLGTTGPESLAIRRPSSSSCGARASPCTPRAPPAWWPSTWPARAC